MSVNLIFNKGKAELFESHQSKREGTPIWFVIFTIVGTAVLTICSRLFVETSVVPLLRGMFSSADIHRAAGVLDTNTFELKTVQSDRVTMIARALYEAASLLNNSCVPSCRREITGDVITVLTSRAVKAGEELTICYTGLLQPTFLRQTVFSQTKHFTCRCLRCQDPTELGSHLSAVLASSGQLLSPADCEDKGRLEMTREDILDLLERCQTMVTRLSSDADCMIWFSLHRKLSALLSLHNYIFVQVGAKLLPRHNVSYLSQFKEKYLLHLADCKSDCMNSSNAETYKVDLAWLNSLLNQPAERSESSTKIIYGADLVKQMLKSKLSDQVYTSTLVKLTE